MDGGDECRFCAMMAVHVKLERARSKALDDIAETLIMLLSGVPHPEVKKLVTEAQDYLMEIRNTRV